MSSERYHDQGFTLFDASCLPIQAFLQISQSSMGKGALLFPRLRLRLLPLLHLLPFLLLPSAPLLLLMALNHQGPFLVMPLLDFTLAGDVLRFDTVPLGGVGRSPRPVHLLLTHLLPFSLLALTEEPAFGFVTVPHGFRRLGRRPAAFARLAPDLRKSLRGRITRNGDPRAGA